MVDTIPIIERRVRYGPAVGRRRRRRGLAQHRQPLLSKTGGQGEPGSILAIADHREPREELQCWSGRYRSAVQCTCGLNPLNLSVKTRAPAALLRGRDLIHGAPYNIVDGDDISIAKALIGARARAPRD